MDDLDFFSIPIFHFLKQKDIKGVSFYKNLHYNIKSPSSLENEKIQIKFQFA